MNEDYGQKRDPISGARPGNENKECKINVRNDRGRCVLNVHDDRDVRD